MIRSEPRRPQRRMAVVAAAVGLATLAIYLTVVLAEGDNRFWEVLAWAMLMLAPTMAAFYAAGASDLRLARRLLFAAIVLFGVVGVLSILGVGIGFMVAAALAAVASSGVSAV